MKLPSTFSYRLQFRLKLFSQHPVFEHPHIILFLEVKDQLSRPYKKNII